MEAEEMKTELTLRCACGVEHLDIDLFLELDEEDSYMSFSSIFGPRRSWRERFKAVWLILRGKNHYFNEIVLDPDKLTELRDFLIVNTTDGGRSGRSQAEIRADLTHVHKWEPALNDVVTSGYICFECGSIKA